MNWYKTAIEEKTVVLDRKRALEELFQKRTSVLDQLRSMATELTTSAENIRSSTPNITSGRANYYEQWALFLEEAMRKIGNPIQSRRM